jgi:hypothetical protein
MSFACFDQPPSTNPARLRAAKIYMARLGELRVAARQRNECFERVSGFWEIINRPLISWESTEDRAL